MLFCAKPHQKCHVSPLESDFLIFGSTFYFLQIIVTFTNGLLINLTMLGNLKSRRALRALKALVRLQALVKGYLVRKHTADMLRGLQALVRAQSRARSGLPKISESPHSSTKSVQFQHPVSEIPVSLGLFNFASDSFYKVYSSKLKFISLIIHQK